MTKIQVRCTVKVLFCTLLCAMVVPVSAGTDDLGTTFSHNRGFYNAPFEVLIFTDIEGGVIKYTLDGSDPRVSSSAFSAVNPCPVMIDPVSTDGRWATPAVTLRACAEAQGDEVTNVNTHTYIFLDKVINQGEIKPSGSYVFWTTAMDPEVTEDPAYAGIMHDTLLSIPTMSVVMDWEDLFGTSGIHRGNNLERGDYERPCSLELIYPESPQFAGFEGFQEDCGIRIQGGGGRWDEGTYDHKQSFGLRFRREYGAGTLNYPVFESAPFNADSEAGEYDKLVLRSGHNKSWGAIWDNIHTVYTRDQFGRDLQIAMSGIGSHGTFVHLYLNGIYWGLYNPCERPDHAFSASYLEGTKQDYYYGKKKNNPNVGDSSRFDTWRNTVSRTSDFATLQQYLAVDAYLDMALIGAYAYVGDYPQYYFGNGNNPAGQIYFYQWDIEDSFGGGSRRSGDPSTSRLGNCYEFSDMWDNNDEFRIRLADRAYRACTNQGYFSDQEATERWLKTCNTIDLAIVGESARWGDERYGDTGHGYKSGYHNPNAVYTRDGYWVQARDTVTADLQGRAAKLISGLRSSGYYPSVNPPLFKHEGSMIDVLRKKVPPGYELGLQRDGSSGTIYYTTDSSDPRHSQADERGPQNVNGGSGITINATTHVKARTKSGDTWSALHEMLLFVDTDLADLALTEIMYHPLPTQAATEVEIVEIIGNDINGGNYDLARVQLAVSPPPMLTEDDLFVISEGANAGEYAIHHVVGKDVILKAILADEASVQANADLYYDGDRYEFIEFKNVGTETLNLSGVGFTKGLRFQFRDGTLLSPGAFAVVAGQAQSFNQRYPGVKIEGEYAGKLSNGGELLEVSLRTGESFGISEIVGDTGGRGKIVFTTLPGGLEPDDRVSITRANNVSNNGTYKIDLIQGTEVYVTRLLTDEGAGARGNFSEVICNVTYDDKAPWPLAPDGQGYSLVAVESDPGSHPSESTYWRTSANVHGTPAEDDPQSLLKPMLAISTKQLSNSVMQGAHASPQDYEIWNQGIGTLNYNIVDDVNWLTVSPAQGTVVGTQDKNVHTVSYTTDVLTGGIHEATIVVVDPCASNSPQHVDVRLEVLAPEIAVSTPALTSRVSEGGTAPEQGIEVWNSGIDTLVYTIADDAVWLDVIPDTGSSTGPDDRHAHTVIYETQGLAIGEHQAAITILDTNAVNDPQVISVTLTVSGQGAFVAYNDLNSTNSSNAAHVTGYDYSANSESLKDFSTGEDLAVTVTGSVSPIGAYDPYGANGGNITNVNSDAYQLFDGIVDLTGVFELDAADWQHVITFNNLEPDKTYTIALTANRDNVNYRDQRFTKVSIEGAEGYINASSMGIADRTESSVSFSTGYNTLNGFVAQWVQVAPGPDGRFSIVSQWDDSQPGSKGYAMSVFRLETHRP